MLSSQGRKVGMLFISTFTIVSAIFQWLIIIERSYAAVWAWYKFYGYSPANPISVNEETQILFFVGSIAIALLALTTLRRGRLLEHERISRKFLVFGHWAGRAIIFGSIWWAILLASPLVIVIRR